MRHYKLIIDGYIVAIGTGPGGTEITTEEYDSLRSVIVTAPSPPAGFGYRLKTDLTWELYELPVIEEHPEATAGDYQAALSEFGVKV